MQIEYTGRQTEVDPGLKALAERKLAKLARVLPGITHVHVIVAADKHRQIAEVSVHSPNLDLAATDETGDLAGSLAGVIDKLARQAQRHVGKRRERKRRGPGRTTALWSGVLAAPPQPPAEGPRVIRSRRVLVKPMSVDEAIQELGRGDDGLLVYRDSASARLNVLYRRKDGQLGLIEPEA
jgi:putative sigma-54 modulation protein